jgi:hypothetical protein
MGRLSCPELEIPAFNVGRGNDETGDIRRREGAGGGEWEVSAGKVRVVGMERVIRAERRGEETFEKEEEWGQDGNEGEQVAQ